MPRELNLRYSAKHLEEERNQVGQAMVQVLCSQHAKGDRTR